MTLRLSVVMVLFLLCLYLLLALVSRQWLFLPLDALRRQVDRISGDPAHLGETIPRPFGRELQALTSSFNLMSRDLAAQRTARIQLNQTLEDKVRERTVQLSASKELAETASRAKSMLLAGMSHELRTPLNAVLGFSHLLRRSSRMDDGDREMLELIHQGGQQLLLLIDNVLDIARLDTGQLQLEPENCDFRQLLDELMSMMRLKAEAKGLEFAVTADITPPPFVYVDGEKLRLVLAQLIGNAINFTELGRVAIRLTCQAGTNVDEVLFGCEITDTGIGIAAGDISRIFLLFEQIDPSRSEQGVGLGLTLSRKILALMGGSIAAASQPNQGSTFILQVPLRLASGVFDSTPPGFTDVVGLAPGQPECRILIVDDGFENRLLLKQLLSPLGFVVREAVNGEEAVQVFAQWQPHLIWMDRRMPRLDGIEATRQIKAMEGGEQTVIVMLTASTFLDQRHELLTAGANDFLRKPFKEREILAAMARHLGVRYQHAPEAEPKAKATTDTLVLTPLLMCELPPVVLSELRLAAMTGDVGRLYAAFQQLGPENARLVSALQKLVDEYRFDRLVQLVNSCDLDDPNSGIE